MFCMLEVVADYTWQESSGGLPQLSILSQLVALKFLADFADQL